MEIPESEKKKREVSGPNTQERNRNSSRKEKKDKEIGPPRSTMTDMMLDVDPEVEEEVAEGLGRRNAAVAKPSYLESTTNLTWRATRSRWT